MMRGMQRRIHGSGRRHGRNLLRPTLLFLMHEGPAHGYELAERLRSFGVIDIDPSLIYRALRDMEAEGYIQSTWDEEKTQGPPRRVYTLTAEGNASLKYYIEDLRTTRSRIDQLTQAYSLHMRKGSGQFHEKQK
ncbi:MAG: helix-turn-helix transcriptional regulator [Anaerolineaceae bacterium]|nr:helix-turn-helix transcriptional regulator [Anaerolineaceae bacterium]